MVVMMPHAVWQTGTTQCSLRDRYPRKLGAERTTNLMEIVVSGFICLFGDAIPVKKKRKKSIHNGRMKDRKKVHMREGTWK
jgi:hypothetical protein